MHLIRSAIAGILTLLSAAASAQVPQFPQNLPANTVVGRLGIGSGPSQAIPFSVLRSRLTSGAISVKDRGALGDGTTDDTAAIQSAVNSACGLVGLAGSATALYFPAGFYKISAPISITCGLKVQGDGWAGDSGALLQNQIISSNANLSGSIIEPTSTSAGLVFATNQAVEVRDIAIVYLSRPTAGSGIAPLAIQASSIASPPAPLAWNLGSLIDHVWLYGGDRNLTFTNAGTFTVSNSLLQMHATTGTLIQGPNLPFAGDWHIGPGNTYFSGSVVTCQHILIQSGGGGSIYNNKMNTCGSNNTVPPLTTTGVQWSPILNVANNSLEPIVVTGNTMEGLTRCLWFYGANVGQNATATQITVSGNQMWCLEDIRIEPTSTNAQWVSGLTIAGNFMNSQTVAGTTTTTNNLNLDGVNNANVVGNTFGLVAGAGGDTSNAINVGANTSSIFQLGNTTLTGVTIPATVPTPPAGNFTIGIPTGGNKGAGTINIAADYYKNGTVIPETVSSPLTLSAGGLLACPNCALISATAHGDSAYAILSTDRYVYTNAAFTAPRTWTLPAANSLAAGTTIWVQDAQGTVTSTNTLTISRAGADTIDIANTTLVITGAGGGITFTTDGVSNWGTPVQTVSTGGTGQKTLTNHGVLVGAAANPITQLAVAATGTVLRGATGADPAFGAVNMATDMTGTMQAAQEPAHTGDCTNSAGALALTCTQSAGDFKVTGILQTGGDARVTTQFDKTTDTTLANVPGLSVTVASGLTYGFQAKLYTTSNAASGIKAAIAGTATATAVTFTMICFDTGGYACYGRSTSLGSAPSGSTTATNTEIDINGTITVNVGGTLTAQFAQNVSGGTASSVLVGSTMKVWKIQ